MMGKWEAAGAVSPSDRWWNPRTAAGEWGVREKGGGVYAQR